MTGESMSCDFSDDLDFESEDFFPDIAETLAVLKEQMTIVGRQLADTTTDLTIRWSIYESLAELSVLSETKSITASLDVINPDWQPFVTFDFRRGQRCSFVSLWEMIQRRIAEYPNEVTDSQKLDLWMEEILKSGYSHFTYDW